VRDFRLEVEIWPFLGCAMTKMQYNRYLSCNINKTVCIILCQKNEIVCTGLYFHVLDFQGTSDLQFVSHFKYLGHIITHNLSDDNDIQREIRSMFVRCNVLIRKFSNCSLRVKVKLFQSYCLCFCDIAFWSSYQATSMCKFRSCYNKCLKLFLGIKI